MSKPSENYFVRLIIVSLTLGASIVLFPAYYVWSGNAQEISIGFGDLISGFLGVAVATVTLLPICIGLLLTRLLKARRLFTLLVFGLALSVWVQANFLLWNYGEFSGGAVDFSGKNWIAIGEIAIWIFVLGAVLGFRQALYPQLVTAAIVLLTIQIIPVAINTLGTAEDDSDQAKFSNDTSHTFTFSARGNTIILVLDAFQHDIFADVLEQDKYEDVLRGFIIYDNAITPSRYTRYSFPTLLSGEKYDGIQDLDIFLERTVKQHNIVSVLESNDYRTTYITGPKDLCYHLRNCFSRYRLLGANEQTRVNVTSVVQGGVFRVVPHVLKSFVFDGRNGLTDTLVRKKEVRRGLIGRNGISKNVDFFNEYIDQMVVDSGPRTFKFIHLANGHPPLSVDENCLYEDMPDTRQNFVRTNHCTMRLLRKFRAALERMGVWDNSLIFMMGDHGARGEDTGIQELEPQLVLGDAWPMLVMKVPSASGPMQVRHAPVELGDIPATIAEVLDLNVQFPGISLTKAVEGDRERIYFFATHGPVPGIKNKRNPFVRYKISGSPGNAANWSK